jgi:hypothetical protein
MFRVTKKVSHRFHKKSFGMAQEGNNPFLLFFLVTHFLLCYMFFTKSRAQKGVGKKTFFCSALRVCKLMSYTFTKEGMR